MQGLKVNTWYVVLGLKATRYDKVVEIRAISEEDARTLVEIEPGYYIKSVSSTKPKDRIISRARRNK